MKTVRAILEQLDPDSPEFQAWFRGSAVVDAEGNPLVVFHGTRARFDRFEPNSWFAQDKSLAEEFYSGSMGYRTRGARRLIAAYLAIRKPLDLSKYGTHYQVKNGRAWAKMIGVPFSRWMETIAKNGPSSIRRHNEKVTRLMREHPRTKYTVYEGPFHFDEFGGYGSDEGPLIKRIGDVEICEAPRPEAVWQILYNDVMIRALTDLGFDGIKCSEGAPSSGQITWMIANPDQVRQATQAQPSRKRA